MEERAVTETNRGKSLPGGVFIGVIVYYLPLLLLKSSGNDFLDVFRPMLAYDGLMLVLPLLGNQEIRFITNIL
jgi:hypothetical protein